MPKQKKTARIGVTLGDPSGIGPEIVAKALCQLPTEVLQRVDLFVDDFIMEDCYGTLGTRPLSSVSTRMNGTLSAGAVIAGQPCVASAQAQVAYLEAGVIAAHAGEIAALVTAPIHKAQAAQAGFAFPGHTEFLAHRFGAGEVAMMFAGPKLKVVLATVHEALADLPRVLTSERIVSAIRLAAQALVEDFAIAAPRIGVLGLNPHAGELGRFGDEEERVIAPAIAAASKLPECTDCELVGPLVPDAAYRMNFDCFIAMYHDQALIPVKLIDFDDSVNLTLGLPIVRTSPDHGVAYDIAGQGIARPTSMLAAIRLAMKLVDLKSAKPS